VRRVHEPGAGLAAARNAGIRNSNGDFLVFLDNGERLPVEAIEDGVGALAEPRVRGAIGGRRGGDGSGRLIYRARCSRRCAGSIPRSAPPRPRLRAPGSPRFRDRRPRRERA